MIHAIPTQQLPSIDQLISHVRTVLLRIIVGFSIGGLFAAIFLFVFFVL